MPEIYLFYLRFDPAPSVEELLEAFPTANWTLLRQQGENPDAFRNFYFSPTVEETGIEAHMNVLPGQVQASTLSLALPIPSARAQVAETFIALQALSEIHPFHLLDGAIQDQHYHALHAAGKVDDLFMGLSPEEQLALEESCYVPLDMEAFEAGVAEVTLRERLLAPLI